MTISLRTRLDAKYFLPATVLTNPYSEDRDGHLYLVNEDGKSAFLCEAIHSIEML